VLHQRGRALHLSELLTPIFLCFRRPVSEATDDSGPLYGSVLRSLGTASYRTCGYLTPLRFVLLLLELNSERRRYGPGNLGEVTVLGGANDFAITAGAFRDRRTIRRKRT
jgi:hypothetical protein